MVASGLTVWVALGMLVALTCGVLLRKMLVLNGGTVVAATWRFLVAEPFRAATTYGHQALITSASVAMNANFAQSHGILDPWFAWAQALGFEWTYLRGLASAKQVQSKWATPLNVAAYCSVVLYGVMYCLIAYGVIPETPGIGLGAVLSFVHVIPIGVTGLFSAMIHRDVAGAEAAQEAAHAAELQKRANNETERQRRLQEAADALLVDQQRKEAELALEMKRKEAELALYSKAQSIKATARQLRPARQMSGRSVEVDGVRYESVAAAAAAHGISRQAMSKRLRKGG